MSTALRSGAVVDLQRLAIAQGRAAWLLYLDLYVLDADGALYDAALLAALAALASLKLPHVAVDEAGKVGPKSASQPIYSTVALHMLGSEEVPGAVCVC